MYITSLVFNIFVDEALCCVRKAFKIDGLQKVIDEVEKC
jgi:hypothetical protein